MLTIDDIKNKVNTFSPGKSVEELIDETIVMYKIEKGWEDFKAEMKLWSKST